MIRKTENERTMITTVNVPYTTQLELNVEDPAVVKTIKTLVRHMKGVMSVKEVKPRIKMTEAEFYNMIEQSAKTVRMDGANMKMADESMSEYVNRLIQTV